MDDNISNAISQLQNMLTSEDGKKNIENMLGSFGIGGNSTQPSQESDFGMSSFNMPSPDNFAMMRNVMEALQRHDDPRSQLLLALKPYLSSSRSAKIDKAIMLLSLGKIPSIMKFMG